MEQYFVKRVSRFPGFQDEIIVCYPKANGIENLWQLICAQSVAAGGGFHPWLMAKQTMNHQETKETHGDPDTGLDLAKIFAHSMLHFSVTLTPSGHNTEVEKDNLSKIDQIR